MQESMEKLREELEHLRSELLTEVQAAEGEATRPLGAVHWRVLVRLVDAYLAARDDPQAKADRRTLVTAGGTALGDALAIVDGILRRWPEEPD